MLYRIAKKSGSRRETKKIKKIRENDSKNISDSFSDDSDSDSSLASDIIWETYRQPDGRK